MIFSVIYFGLVSILIWINYDIEVKYPGKTIELTVGLDKIIQMWGIVCALTILFVVYVILYFGAITLPLLGEEFRGFMVGFIFFNVLNDLKILLRVRVRD